MKYPHEISPDLPEPRSDAGVEIVEADPKDFTYPQPEPPKTRPDFLTQEDVDNFSIRIVGRTEWGAQRPKWIDVLKLPIDKIAVTYTETNTCRSEEECKEFVRNLQKTHQEDPEVPDIKHNFLIGGDGLIYEGRGYTRLGPVYEPSQKKIEMLNGISIDIGLIQYYREKPTKEMVRALSYCISNGIDHKYILNDFLTYYIAFGEVEHIQPHSQKGSAPKIKGDEPPK